ncbi:MAG: hypothetical protein P1Q69_03235 [Candidatus Thorarchaeota archaeon]|nr:hypothetical protein [Candidatus Thorarchaeota archaeon]
MYVKIRTDGALGIAKGTEGDQEITLGYGEAHMIAAALDKLAQTARSYKQTYKKTTNTGKGNKIDFERSDSGSITLAGDGMKYICTEKEIRELSETLKHLPAVEVAPPSDYVQKVKPDQGTCLNLQNGGSSIPLKLYEAALLKTAVKSSINSRFFQQNLSVAGKSLGIQRLSDLKWKVVTSGSEVKFTAYEVEALLGGLHNGVLDVLMDLIKSFGNDKLADIRVKSHIQRIEAESSEIFEDEKTGKGMSRELLKSTKKILGTGVDAEARTLEFINLCDYVYGQLNPIYHQAIFDLFSRVFVSG